MNLDIQKMHELAETKRANRAKEAIEDKKANAAVFANRIKAAEAGFKAASGVAGLVGANDLGWYKSKEQLLLDVASMSFAKFITSRIENTSRVTPVLVTLRFTPITGFGSDDTYSQLTMLSVKELFDALRAKNRSETPYTVNDLVSYIMCVGSTFPVIGYAEKVLKAFHYAEAMNPATVAVLPVELLNGGNSTYSEIEEYIADYNQEISELPALEEAIVAAKKALSALPVPSSLPLIRRWIWLSSFVFEDSHKVQKSYFSCAPDRMYTPLGISDDSAGTFAKSEILNFDGTIAGIITWLRKAIRILASMNTMDTYQRIAGDIINAFGDGVYNAKYPVAYEDPFIYDEEFLLQYQNMDIYGTTPTGTLLVDQFALRLDENTGYITQGLRNALKQFTGYVLQIPSEKGLLAISAPKIVRPFGDSYELTKEQIFMGLRMACKASGPMESITYYYWNEGEWVSASLAAAAGTKLAVLVRTGTEIYHNQVMTTCTCNGEGKVLLSHIEINDEILDAIDNDETLAYQQLEHKPTLFDPDHELLSPCDSYALISEADRLGDILSVGTMGLWGDALTNVANMFKNSGSGNKPSRFDKKKDKRGNQPKDPEGKAPEKA